MHKPSVVQSGDAEAQCGPVWGCRSPLGSNIHRPKGPLKVLQPLQKSLPNSGTCSGTFTKPVSGPNMAQGSLSAKCSVGHLDIHGLISFSLGFSHVREVPLFLPLGCRGAKQFSSHGVCMGQRWHVYSSLFDSSTSPIWKQQTKS